MKWQDEIAWGAAFNLPSPPMHNASLHVFLHRHFDFTFHHPDRIGPHRSGRNGQACTRLQIEFPTMKRTGHSAFLGSDPTRPQGATPVRAIVFQRVDLVIHIEDGDPLPRDLDSASLAFHKVRNGSDRRKIGHWAKFMGAHC